MRSDRFIVGFALTALLAGCGSPPAGYVRYVTFAAKEAASGGLEGEKLTAAQWQEIDDAMVAMFGTPDDPKLPALEDDNGPIEWTGVVSLSRLKMAAGPVGSDEDGRPHGLYREHCAHCHGVTGDGNGPTAIFLNPYPRDYRPGWFKFKSTPIGQKPTHDDLKKILVEGIPGTAMPSFKLLPENEVEALVDYVKYLALRGESERSLIHKLVEDEHLYDVRAENELQEQLGEVRQLVAKVAQKWKRASSVAIDPRGDMSPEELAKSRAHGRELFYGAIANCVKCHGESALGDGQITDYDNWVKDLVDPNKPDTAADVKKYVSLGMLPPRNIRPRNLRLGVFRGGMRPVDIYWRIVNGIEGTPMPAAPMRDEANPNPKTLTKEDVWDLVNYVQSLPYEPLSQPPHFAPSLSKERM
jgi:mono/diheme cytochrome c family protein